MGTLSIRNLPDDVHGLLRIRAARAGRSMEAEAREILAAACRGEVPGRDPRELQALVDEMYGEESPRHVVDEFIRERRLEASSE